MGNDKKISPLAKTCLKPRKNTINTGFGATKNTECFAPMMLA
jgi:hypothetical protein